MRYLLGMGIVAMFLSAAGCGTSQSASEQHTFTFVHEDAEYTIISRIVPSNGSSNYLIRREEGATLLRAVDEDQDGFLDALLVGDIPLEEANAVYAVGIAEAQHRGVYRERLSERLYMLSRYGENYVVRTYVGVSGTSYNKFIILDSGREPEAVWIDREADGVLDERIRGEANHERSQERYEMVLEHGLRDGRIVKRDTAYFVEAR